MDVSISYLYLLTCANMSSLRLVFIHISLIILLCCLCTIESDDEVQALEKIFSKCKKKSPQFDACIQRALNQLQPFFKRGIPEIGVAPFDPHFAPTVTQEREIFGVRYALILRDVYEKGWTQSIVTKYKTDLKNAMLIYSQLFPEKSINAQYEFKGEAFGTGLARSGRLSLTLRNYTQTTSVARRGAGVAVRVAAGRVGALDLRLTGLANDTVVERWLDVIIKTFWKPAFAVIKPAINDLVSAAFTDIWSKSFKNFNIDQFIKD